MATTDSRTGFRLPWSTDRAASREASAEPADELVAAAPASDTDTPPASMPGPGDTIDQGAAGDGALGQEGLVTTLAPDAAQHPVTAASPAPEPATPWAATQADDAPAPIADAPAPAPDAGPGLPSLAPTPARRPTKFLADLTRAMQAAAEQARSATLEQYRSEGTSVIEQIHARSATGATELRRHADDDVAAIKDWSKAEIARIREETERRITSRREQLEGQLERHAAIIEHEIEKVRGRISTFESDMGTFFDDLLREEDPAVFAARAANLPEPPSFENLDDDAVASLLEEPGVGVPPPAVEAVADAPVEVEAGPEAAAALVVEDEPEAPPEIEAAADVAVAAVGDVEVASEMGTDTEDAVETAELQPSDDGSVDREAAMAAIQAAAEAAASFEMADAVTEAADAALDQTDEAPAPEPQAEADAEVESPVEVDATPAPDTMPRPELDPRLAMLGLTPDFAAAEEAAAEAAAAEVEDLPEIGGDALEARLSGLVPGEAHGPATETVTTQVIVTGLVSVASIASFKRHLGRLAGVAHVGVSSGPDGEFLFSVQHEQGTSLRELIPTLPGFGARVVGAGDGIVHVSAQDPQD